MALLWRGKAMSKFYPFKPQVQDRLVVAADTPTLPVVDSVECNSRELSARQSGILIGAISGAVGGVLLTLIARGL